MSKRGDLQRQTALKWLFGRRHFVDAEPMVDCGNNDSRLSDRSEPLYIYVFVWFYITNMYYTSEVMHA
jgi:hypothetical protein